MYETKTGRRFVLSQYSCEEWAEIQEKAMILLGVDEKAAKAHGNTIRTAVRV